MNFSVVVRFFRDAVGMFCCLSDAEVWCWEFGTYVVYRGEGAVRSPDLPAGIPQTLEGLL